MIVRYRGDAYARRCSPATIFVGAVVSWSFVAWILVGLVLTFVACSSSNDRRGDLGES